MTLFRKEVLESKNRRLGGEVKISIPIPFRVFIFVVFCLSALMMAALIFLEIPKRQSVKGWIVPDKGLLEVRSPTDGVVLNVFVTEGGRVEVGDPILEFGNNLSLIEDESYLSSVIEDLAMQKDALSRKREAIAEEITSIKLKYKIEQKNLESKRNSLEEANQLAKLEQERVEKIVETYRRLSADGTTSQLELDNQLRIAGSVTRSKIQQSIELNAVISEIKSIEPALKETISGKYGVLADIDFSLAELSKQLREAKLSNSRTETASIDGFTFDISAKNGMSVETGTKLLSLLPLESVLEANLFVPTKSTGMIKPGQIVHLRLDAFPHNKFGVLTGKVKNVSQTVYNPESLSIDLGIDSPVYVVTVECPKQYLEAYGNKFILKPGMTLEAEIVEGKSSLLGSLVGN